MKQPRHQFQYTRRWFRHRNQAAFIEHVQPRWEDKPIFYLEIGVWEGMSLAWMMQNVLTHPNSHAVGIDPWVEIGRWSEESLEQIRQRAVHNLSPWRDRCVLVRSNSDRAMLHALHTRGGSHGMRRNSADVLMVDGDHRAEPVKNDCGLALQLVKPGGWLLFDDVDESPKKKGHVADGVKMFLAEHGDEVRLLWKSRYVECYEKI